MSTVPRVFSGEIVSNVAPARLFRVGATQSHVLVPKVMPQFVSSVDILQGDGGVGSIRQYTFTDVLPYKHMKQVITLVDEERFEFKHTQLEGGLLGDKIEKADKHFKLEPTPDGGCVCKYSTALYPLPGVELTDEDVNAQEGDFVAVFKAMEQYLVANPDACT